MKNNLSTILLLLVFAVLSGCRSGVQTSTQVKEPVAVTVSDYGHALFSLDPERVEQGLDSLSAEFAIFTGTDRDTLQVLQIHEFIIDPFNRELAQKCREVYPDLNFLEKDLGMLFANILAIHPEFKPPRVYTYISGLLYESPVQYIDSALVIGLDMFLGWDYEQYRAAGLPVFLTRRMQPQNIVPECARQYAISIIPEESEPKNLLDFMLFHGKLLYAMDCFLPDTPDSLKIGYTAGQMDWCNKNELEIWRLFIDQEMLYKSDPFLNNRFIQDGPFTAGLPEGAPAMLGRYIGWQIVKSYMAKHGNITLDQLFALDDSQQILSKSGYKPKR